MNATRAGAQGDEMDEPREDRKMGSSGLASPSVM